MLSLHQRCSHRPGIALFLTLAVTATSAFAVECGDTLGPGGTYELDKDLQCQLPSTIPRTTPALVLLSGARLEMRHHSLTCLNNPQETVIGIQLHGKGAALRGGSIENCGYAVELLDEGGHSVSNMSISGDFANLINIRSPRNMVRDNILSSGDWAFAVLADENILLRNQSLSGQGDGFMVGGSRNLLIDNSVTSSVCNGFAVTGSDNLLIHNESVGTLLCGTFSIRGERNALVRNTARDSVSDGFGVFGSGHTFVNNVARSNAGSGLHVLSGSTGNSIIRTIAADNAVFDLQDDNPDCDNNRWRANVFRTSNNACIR
jgi:parallel beta helix pectate lyase-like protein